MRSLTLHAFVFDAEREIQGPGLDILERRVSALDKFGVDPADSTFPFAFEKADLHAGAFVFQDLYGSLLIGGEGIPISGENAKVEDWLIGCLCFH